MMESVETVPRRIRVSSGRVHLWDGHRTLCGNLPKYFYNAEGQHINCPTCRLRGLRKPPTPLVVTEEWAK